MVRFGASAGKSNKTVSTSWSFTGDRWFESISPQRAGANLTSLIRAVHWDSLRELAAAIGVYVSARRRRDGLMAI